MKTRLIFTAILTLFASVALAGLYAPMPVSIDYAGKFASGDMWSARFSYDEVAFIGCGALSIDDGAGGAFQYGVCEATDSEGNYASCFTANAALVESIHAISDFSFLIFSWHDDGVSCKEVSAVMESSYLHKRLGK